MINTNGPNDININDLLIEEGYAMYYDAYQLSRFSVSNFNISQFFNLICIILIYRLFSEQLEPKTVFFRKTSNVRIN